MSGFTVLDESLLIEGNEYSVGLNDGSIFKRIVYKGTTFFAGKNIMKFKTEHGSTLTINPSYHVFTLEEEGQFPMPEDFNNNKGEEDNG
tara:strand:+ start:177 stop:443 length:267 start_codon:yes stop_codon:yes gene_type:complete